MSAFPVCSVSEQFLILLANMLLVGVCVIPIRYIGKKMLARARVVQSLSLIHISAMIPQKYAMTTVSRHHRKR